MSATRGGRHRSVSLLVAGVAGAVLAVLAATLPAAADTAPARTAVETDPRHLAPGSVTEIVIGGGAAVPVDASAVALNVTATQPTAPGYVSLYPCGAARPTVSNVNYVQGQTVANAAIVPLGEGGKVCVYTFTPVNVVIDVVGWYGPGAFGAITPSRLVDTRESNVRAAPGTVVEVPVAGVAGIATDAAAAAVNVTVTNPAAAGYATAFPCGMAPPAVSNVNYRAGQTVAGSAVVPLGSDGKICVTSYAEADLIVDVYGGLGATGLTTTTPTRLADTRAGADVAAGTALTVKVPSAPGASVALAVTAVPVGAAGYLTAYPCDGPTPASSNVNYGVLREVSNLALSLVGEGSTVCVYSSAAADVIVDWFGTLPADGGFSGITPVRVYDSRDTTDPLPYPANAPPPPANSGTGRRVVYSNSGQRVWLVDPEGIVERTYLVSGRQGVPSPGTYSVYSKSRYACSVTCAAHMEYMVRFAVSASGNGIGFHSIPYQNGAPLQNEAALGEFRSAGCVRQALPDAIFLWNWAAVGTKVVVTP